MTRQPWLLAKSLSSISDISRKPRNSAGCVTTYSDPRDNASVIFSTRPGSSSAIFNLSLNALLALPGVGPYTARAVLAFAFERAVTPLDVNTARPLVRAFGACSQADVDGLVPEGRAWDWNQALMDLGATVCTRRDPDCDACPLAPGCAWRGAGPDPAAPAGRQSSFEGSGRQGRGRLVAALRRAPVPFDRLAETTGWPDAPDRAADVARHLVADGLAVVDDGVLRLP